MSGPAGGGGGGRGGGGGGGSRARPGPRAVAVGAAVAVLLALTVLAAGTAGPAPRDPVRSLPVSGPGPAPSTTPTPVRSAPEQDLDHVKNQVQLEVPVADLVVVGVLMAFALVTLLLRRRRARPDEPALPGAGASLRAGPAAVADARPLIDRALATAEHELADPTHREPRDAVVACWLRLEEGAAAAGVRRLPAQTPTEFTTALLSALVPGEAERAALEELRRLYAQARFGSTPLDDAAPQRAAVALAAVRAGLLAAGPVPPGLAGPLAERGRG